MRCFFRTAALLLALAFCLAGCGSRKAEVAQEVADQDFQMDADATIRIVDPCGSVSIRGTDSTGLHLRTTKKAGSSEQLKNIGVIISTEHDDFAVKTTLLRPKGKPFFGGGDSVDYELAVPRTVKIQRLEVDQGSVSLEGLENGQIAANVVDGRLTAKDCYGNVQVSVQNGMLDLRYDRPETPASTIMARVLSGTARLTISATASFRVAAETPGGTITNNLSAMVQLNGDSSRKLGFSNGKPPRSEIQLKVVNGNVTIGGNAIARTTVAAAAAGGR
jgi:hypothetical protein